MPMALAELLLEAGLPEGILQVVNGDKEVVDAIWTMKRSKLLALLGVHRLQNIYIQEVVPMERVQCFAEQKSYADHARCRYGSSS